MAIKLAKHNTMDLENIKCQLVNNSQYQITMSDIVKSNLPKKKREYSIKRFRVIEDSDLILPDLATSKPNIPNIDAIPVALFPTERRVDMNITNIQGIQKSRPVPYTARIIKEREQCNNSTTVFILPTHNTIQDIL